MKTKKEIRQYAEGLAWDHFYSDDGIPWEPFEDHPKEWLDEQCKDLGDAIETAMLWAQGGMK
jgi:hypothetical protein